MAEDGRGRSRISFEAQVPDAFNLELNTGGGDIRIEDISGNVETDTSGGNVSIGRVPAGTVEAVKSGSSIEAELGNVAPGEDAHVDLSSSGGDIELRIPSSHSADVSVRIEVSRCARVDYRIYTDFPLAISGENDREVIGRGEINGGGDRINIEINNGDIRIMGSGN